jgi:DNA-binding GntR family transcriptional regulator
MINQLWRDVLRIRSQYLLTPHGHRDSTREHRLILGALESCDRRRAYELVREHCEHSKVTLLGGDARPLEQRRPREADLLEVR